MRKEVINLYKFEELSDDAKKNAIENYRESMDWQIESEFITEKFVEKLSDMGYPIDDLEWRLNYSQGDGVAFYGEVDIDKVMDRLRRKGYDLNYDLYKAIDNENLTITARIYRNSFGYRYNHYNTMKVEIDGDSIETMMEYLYRDLDSDTDEYVDKYDEIYNFLLNLRDCIHNDIKDVSKQLEKEGYNDIEYYSSDEYIVETLIANEYEFTEDGVMY